MIEAKKPNGEPIFDTDLMIATYRMFLLAGSGTISKLVIMIIYHLNQNPIYIEKLRNEINDNIPDIENLKYD